MLFVAVGLALTPVTLDVISDARQASGLDTIRIRRIIIEGNTTTAERVIRNQLPFRAGQRLRYSLLEQGRLNLIVSVYSMRKNR